MTDDIYVRYQRAIDEIRAVCDRHGIVLVGTCYDESIFGEISILSRRDFDSPGNNWEGINDRLTNQVVLPTARWEPSPYVLGIGSPQLTESGE